ncbi:hypothetical protein VNO77_05044 [Canavalia gladiata]|uniref:Uncharacterized protein n=1 Tax=Canavalia gladiata TaxID=3824 RepID=A0AAN9N3B3_CANGL
MELAGVIWEAATCLFSCSKVHAAYVCKLEENLKSLQEKCDHLQNFSSDVQTRINEAEATGEMQRTSEVKDWLQQVQNLQKTSHFLSNFIAIIRRMNEKRSHKRRKDLDVVEGGSSWVWCLKRRNISCLEEKPIYSCLRSRSKQWGMLKIVK